MARCASEFLGFGGLALFKVYLESAKRPSDAAPRLEGLFTCQRISGSFVDFAYGSLVGINGVFPLGLNAWNMRCLLA